MNILSWSNTNGRDQIYNKVLWALLDWIAFKRMIPYKSDKNGVYICMFLKVYTDSYIHCRYQLNSQNVKCFEWKGLWKSFFFWYPKFSDHVWNSPDVNRSLICKESSRGLTFCQCYKSTNLLFDRIVEQTSCHVSCSMLLFLNTFPTHMQILPQGTIDTYLCKQPVVIVIQKVLQTTFLNSVVVY